MTHQDTLLLVICYNVMIRRNNKNKRIYHCTQVCPSRMMNDINTIGNVHLLYGCSSPRVPVAIYISALYGPSRNIELHLTARDEFKHENDMKIFYIYYLICLAILNCEFTRNFD